MMRATTHPLQAAPSRFCLASDLAHTSIGTPQDLQSWLLC